MEFLRPSGFGFAFGFFGGRAGEPGLSTGPSEAEADEFPCRAMMTVCSSGRGGAEGACRVRASFL